MTVVVVGVQALSMVHATMMVLGTVIVGVTLKMLEMVGRRCCDGVVKGRVVWFGERV